jgi:dipeptidyl aminopeptidase/acylaminoacyl peptidase
MGSLLRARRPRRRTRIWLLADRGFNLALNPNVPVTSKTSPTFLLKAEDDPVDPVTNSLVYYIALKKAGVPVEMHLYAKEGMGLGCGAPSFRSQHGLSWWRRG